MGKEFVKDALTASGGISSGAFSPDRSRLVVGNSTGKLHLLQVWDEDEDDDVPRERPAIQGPNYVSTKLKGKIGLQKEAQLTSFHVRSSRSLPLPP